MKTVKVVLKFALEVADDFDASRLDDPLTLIEGGLKAVLKHREQATIQPGASVRLTYPKG